MPGLKGRGCNPASDIDMIRTLIYRGRVSVHTLRRFDDELSQLKERVLSMGGLVERAIENALESLLEQNDRLARKTISRDAAINAMEIQCDDITRGILVRRQPAAADLRFIIAAIKVVTDLERMGDLAVCLARDAIQIMDHPPANFSRLEAMGDQVQQQTNHALDAFSRGDINLAMSVIRENSGVDELYKSMYRGVIARMLDDQRTIGTSITLSNAAMNLDRIANHTTNIAEMVIYMQRGYDIRHVGHKAAARILAS